MGEEDQVAGHQEVGREAVHRQIRYHHLPGALEAVHRAQAVAAVLALAAAIVAAVVLLQHSRHLVGGDQDRTLTFSKERELELLLLDFFGIWRKPDQQFRRPCERDRERERQRAEKGRERERKRQRAKTHRERKGKEHQNEMQ